MKVWLPPIDISIYQQVKLWFASISLNWFQMNLRMLDVKTLVLVISDQKLCVYYWDEK